MGQNLVAGALPSSFGIMKSIDSFGIYGKVSIYFGWGENIGFRKVYYGEVDFCEKNKEFV